MKVAWVVLLVVACHCLLLSPAAAIGAIPEIGITGSGKTTTGNALTGCKGDTGGSAQAVTHEATILDSETCSGVKQNFQLVDTAGFMHHSKDKIIHEGTEISGKTFSLLNIADALQLNPDILAISLVHSCANRVDESYLESLSQIVDLVSPVPIPFHITFTQCTDAHCLQCKEAYQNNLQLWNRVFGCFGGTCGSSDPNSILGRPRLLGATFVEHEGCTAGNEVSCINVKKLREDFAKWTAPLTPVKFKIPDDYKQKILAGDIPTTKRHAKEQYCGSYIHSYETMLRSNGETYARVIHLREQLAIASTEPLPPIGHSLESSCPAPNREHCVITTRECHGRKYGFFGPRMCEDIRTDNHACLQGQAQAHQQCHHNYHQSVHDHNQRAQAQKNERIHNLHTWIAEQVQEHGRVKGLMEQIQHQYNFCKTP